MGIKRMSHARRKEPLWKRFRYVLVLLSGGVGVGGWQLKDHPILKDFLVELSKSSPDDPLVTGKTIEAAAKALTPSETFHEPGSFDVKIANVEIDPSIAKAGHAQDIQVRVRKRDAQGRETFVWESKNRGQASADPSHNGAAGLSDREFQVEWKPGDQFNVEVWDRTGFFTTKHFEMVPAANDTFPLKSGEHNLAVVGWGKSNDDPAVNRIVFESRRLSTSDAPRTAGKAPRDDDTIVIK
jgi:hypothetical protein